MPQVQAGNQKNYKMIDEKPKTLTLKITDSVKHELKKIAKKEQRSLHGQILYILKKYAEDNLTNPKN